MNLIDVLIVMFVLIVAVRGVRIGFFRQFGSLGGLALGVVVGAYAAPVAAHLVSTPSTRAVVVMVTIFACAVIVSTAGEVAGLWVSQRFQHWRLGVVDMGAGAAFGSIVALLVVWMVGSVLGQASIAGLATQTQRSHILRTLNDNLPPAPDVLARVERFIDPNGFPQVFAGLEPTPAAPVTGPNAAEINAAAAAGRPSTVRIEGEGCGGIIEGSGFVVGSNLIATNAHVVAGIKQPVVIDQYGSHDATTVVFDPNMDFAVLRVNGLRDPVLPLSDVDVPRGTVGAALGYPGGGPFTVSSAAVLQKQDAVGRNIYDRGVVKRSIYELQASVHPGNSGGPLITSNGVVIGVVFAASSTTDNIGYALTSTEVKPEVAQASGAGAVSTGACAVE